MKILKLRFKNLNSLYGEWCIDFTTPEYVANGIFAITGPTGSGKSTILDAICLALYGATPRLGKITKNSNEIMSRQTGECFAEVTFAAAAGQFICHWQQHRARKKATGNLIETRHEIADADSGTILESKKRNVATVIEQKTGMNFERFTRSILLAQGGFDTFLKADSDHRAPILEQITGSEIYTEISKRVHERQRDEREKLSLLQAETAGIAILTDEQEAGITTELEEQQKSENRLAAEYQKIETAVLWLNSIDKLRREIAVLTQENVTQAQINAAFEPERKKLAQAQKAAELEGEFATLSTLRQQHKSDQVQLEIITNELPEKEQAVALQEKILKNAMAAVGKAKAEQKTIAQTIRQVRLLDQQLADRNTAIDTQEKEYRKLSNQISAQQQNLKQFQENLKTVRQEIERVQEYQSANRRDESLTTQLAGIREQTNNLQEIANNIAAKEKMLRAAERKLKNATKDVNSQTLALNKQQQENQSSQKLIQQKKAERQDLLKNRLLREYRSEKENLLKEMLFLHKISELETERDLLTDGKPCPLCGATTHPFAKADTPEISSTEKKINTITHIIDQAEQLENSIRQLELTEKEDLAKVNDIEKLLVKSLNEKKNCEKNRDLIITELDQLKQHITQSQAALLARLKPLEINEIPADNPDKLLVSLQSRYDRWLDMQDKKESITKQSNDLSNETERVTAIITTLNHAADDKKSSLIINRKEYDNLLSERRRLFGSKNPEIEESRLEKAVIDAEINEKTAREKRDQAQQALSTAKVQITSLQKRIRERDSEIQTEAAGFITNLQKTGFADEAEFLICRLPAAERNQLDLRAREIDKLLNELKTRKKDRENRLNEELTKKVTAAELSELLPEQEKLSAALKEIRDEIGGRKQRLADNRQARAKIKEKQAVIEAQKRECHKWEKLHSLIGSADGKKFRNFAQGLTFELMVAHANQQLEKMTDRYLLLRDDKEPLELNVVDNYQAGEIRSTKNLSGGESFIVSLALALGLAKMASRRVRVDSLFLDEGFGTLDEEALETALETLANLQQDSKLIGIISHVPALKERISARINILPGPGGKSLINGPGCQNI